jgi:hypothetical protein
MKPAVSHSWLFLLFFGGFHPQDQMRPQVIVGFSGLRNQGLHIIEHWTSIYSGDITYKDLFPPRNHPLYGAGSLDIYFFCNEPPYWRSIVSVNSPFSTRSTTANLKPDL